MVFLGAHVIGELILVRRIERIVRNWSANLCG